MDDTPFEPKIIVFIVFLILGVLKNLFKKGGNNKGKKQPNAPTLDDNDPLAEFRRMIEEARQKAKEDELEPAGFDTPPPVEVREPITEFTAPQYNTTPISSATPVAVKAFPSTDSSSRKKRKKATNDLSISALLKNPSAARQAIILTEVLGKPKSLKRTSENYLN